ncbi:hypothetical protein [Georgenia alba]|uniref:Uncharacterized protein n=1 Tax=Georgenia alba TaxID=2233858 RepID=A0ABW2QCF5_9MICO
MATMEEARAAKRALREALAAADGVTGLGIAPAPAGRPRPAADDGTPGGTEADQWCVLVNVVSSEARADIPAEVSGVPVRVRVTGTIEAL